MKRYKIRLIKEIHIIYSYKGKIYEAFKNWSFAHAEEVLKRLGADYWDIGV